MTVKLHDGTECAEPECHALTSATDGRCHEHSVPVFRELVGPDVGREQAAPIRKALILRGADR